MIFVDYSPLHYKKTAVNIFSMSGFLNSFAPIKISFSPLFKRLKKYKIEIILLIFALITALISVGVYFVSQKETAEEPVFFEKKTITPSFSKIFVDIAGAVEKPNVYEVTVGARLKDVLVMAGGLSADADRKFFSRNFNLAKIVADQEKIYIPSTEEVKNGFFVENQQTLPNPSQTISKKININTASLEELDQLPGVGKVTAQKIIDGRPYQSLEELLTKKVINKGVYDKIINIITTN
ncbi:MAG: helix-hairpin-helix domain-containing protein [Microgenomates group bacterium]